MTAELTKRCPFCAEEILAAAIRCKHCQADLNAGESPKPPAKKVGEVLGITPLLIPLVGTLLIWLWVANMNLFQDPGSTLVVVAVLTVFGTAVISAIEASQLGIGGDSDKDSKGRRCSGPVAWAVFHVALWIVAFPGYLFWRSKYGAKNMVIGGILLMIAFLGSALVLNIAIDERKAELRSNLEKFQVDTPPQTIPAVEYSSASSAATNIQFVAKSLVADGQSCVVLTDGTVRCWGSNNSGQLGNNTTGTCGNESPEYPCSVTPIAVSGITDATAVTAGIMHTCALLTGGAVRCWGSNTGNGTNAPSSVPVSLKGITDAIAVSVGSSHSCFVLKGGSVQCWGKNKFGELGNGTGGGGLSARTLTPVAVTGITNAIAVSAGSSHTCALLRGGSAQCWGRNSDGQLGSGNTEETNVPVAVSGF